MAEKNQSKLKAVQDLEAIDILRRSEPFQKYFAARVNAPCKQLAQKILYDVNLTKDQVWEELIKFRAHFEISKVLIEDDAACRSFIEQEREGEGG